MEQHVHASDAPLENTALHKYHAELVQREHTKLHLVPRHVSCALKRLLLMSRGASNARRVL